MPLLQPAGHPTIDGQKPVREHRQGRLLHRLGHARPRAARNPQPTAPGTSPTGRQRRHRHGVEHRHPRTAAARAALRNLEDGTDRAAALSAPSTRIFSPEHAAVSLGNTRHVRRVTKSKKKD